MKGKIFGPWLTSISTLCAWLKILVVNLLQPNFGVCVFSSYGSVFKAIHKESGQVVAIKQVPVESDLQEIIKEISIMQQCDRLEENTAFSKPPNPLKHPLFSKCQSWISNAIYTINCCSSFISWPIRVILTSAIFGLNGSLCSPLITALPGISSQPLRSEVLWQLLQEHRLVDCHGVLWSRLGLGHHQTAQQDGGCLLRTTFVVLVSFQWFTDDPVSIYVTYFTQQIVYNVCYR